MVAVLLCVFGFMIALMMLRILMWLTLLTGWSSWAPSLASSFPEIPQCAGIHCRTAFLLSALRRVAVWSVFMFESVIGVGEGGGQGHKTVSINHNHTSTQWAKWKWKDGGQLSCVAPNVLYLIRCTQTRVTVDQPETRNFDGPTTNRTRSLKEWTNAVSTRWTIPTTAHSAVFKSSRLKRSLIKKNIYIYKKTSLLRRV